MRIINKGDVNGDGIIVFYDINDTKDKIKVQKIIDYCLKHSKKCFDNYGLLFIDNSTLNKQIIKIIETF